MVLGSALDYRAHAELAAGRTAEAAASATRSLAAHRSIGYQEGLASSGTLAANLALMGGNHERADTLLHQALDVTRRLHHLGGTASVLEAMAVLNHDRGDRPHAAANLAEARALRRRTGAAPSGGWRRGSRRRDAARALAGDVVEMRRRTADDGAEGDDAVATPRCRDPLDGERHLEGAGDPHQFDVGIAGTVPAQRRYRGSHERVDDEVVEARRDDREADVASDQRENAPSSVSAARNPRGGRIASVASSRAMTAAQSIRPPFRVKTASGSGRACA